MTKHHNLLVIMTDQQRYDAMGAVQKRMGIPERSRVRTPNLDRLLAQSQFFSRAYSPCPVCGPARTSLLTGNTVSRHGVNTNQLAYDRYMSGTDNERLLERCRSYDDILVKDHGYTAEYYGKWHAPERLGTCYANDVRQAGVDDTWFGRRNADGGRRIVDGLEAAYRKFLDAHCPRREAVPGEQIHTFSLRPYIPDPLDVRHGMNPVDLSPENGFPAALCTQPAIHGMDLVPEDCSITAMLTGETLDALERLAKGPGPFSLTCSYHYPHAPMTPTRRYYELYDPDDMILPGSLEDDMARSAYRHANGRGRIGTGYADPGKVRRWTANYYGLVTELDDGIGRILTRLDELRLGGNTVVVFVSDHGEMLGAHGLREKNVFYEESVRVPLMIRVPGRPARIVGDPVSAVDLHASVLDACGVRTADATGCVEGLDVRSRALARFERCGYRQEFAVSEWNYTDRYAPRPAGSAPAYMIATREWKLMLPNVSGGEKDSARKMLFNLGEDPLEMNNLLATPSRLSEDAKNTAIRLHRLLVAEIAAAGDVLADELRNMDVLGA